MTVDREPTGSPVTAVRRTSRGPSAGLALGGVVVAVAAAIAIAVVSAPGPRPSPLELAVASASPSAAAQPTPRPTPTPAPDVTSTVVILRGVDDPPGALATLTGCPLPKRSTGFPLIPSIQGVDVDSVADKAGRDTGWLFVPPGIQASSRVWLGVDLVELAHAVGQPVAAVSPAGEVWLGGASGATRWVPISTPMGRTAWVMARDDITGAGACGPWIIPAGIAHQRSVTCSGMDAAACLRLFARARSDVAGIEYGGGDTTVAIAVCRQRSLGCFNRPVVVVATPTGWPATTTELRAAVPAPASGKFAITEESLLPDYVLDLLARASLPLPIGGERVAGNDCAQRLAGPLHGSAWDPRVAWVGEQPVVWPSGTSAWFVPGAVVEVIGRTDGTTAREDDRVALTGMLDSQGRFNACTMMLAANASAGMAGSGLVGEVPAVTPGPLGGRGTGS